MSVYALDALLLLWNISVWDVSLEDPEYMQYIKQHMNRLIKHGYHPFQETLSIEDVSYGHTSPLLIARMFALCARYTTMSNKHTIRSAAVTTPRAVTHEHVTPHYQ